MTSTTPSIIALAQGKPPRSLVGFRASFAIIPAEPDGADCVAFDLSCRNCGARAFDLRELSAELGAAAIMARCCACEHEAQVFSAVTDGYDGAFGHPHFLKDIVSAKPLENTVGDAVGAVQVRAGFSYSIPMAELIENAREAGVEPQDLFDWFHILTRPANAEIWDWTWDYECA